MYAVVDHELRQGRSSSRAIPDNILVLAELHSAGPKRWREWLSVLDRVPTELQYPAVGVILVPTEDTKRVFRIVRRSEFMERMGSNESGLPGPYWNAFFNAFPQAWGYYSFSCPVFAADGQACVISWTWNCGPLCMNWMVARLELVEGRWALVETVLLGTA